MELKLSLSLPFAVRLTVLIVPFMELKPPLLDLSGEEIMGLNRTFYGIETHIGGFALAAAAGLNRTFYGIETLAALCSLRWRLRCLNRTFYGIETLSEELPRLSSGSLNRTFYGIETELADGNAATITES